jgi:hypothetical protein
MADFGVELANDVLHILRAWEASQDALSDILAENDINAKQLEDLREYIERLKVAAGLKWGESLIEAIYKLKHPDPVPVPRINKEFCTHDKLERRQTRS